MDIGWQAFGSELLRAHDSCQRFRLSQNRAELNVAWDVYYNVFRRISKQIAKLNLLELQHVSPKLLDARDLELAVPGTYFAGAQIVCIAFFARSMVVIASKQRPRKLTIHGSDGSEHAFLLKGHEDLRQVLQTVRVVWCEHLRVALAPNTATKAHFTCLVLCMRTDALFLQIKWSVSVHALVAG